jgi:3-hydroxybutyryl-CoA dehydrogenase
MARIEKLVVIGAGTMGHGIAQVAAGAGLSAGLHDVTDELIQKGIAAIRANLDRGVEKGKVSEAQRSSTLGKVFAAPNLSQAAAAADCVIEAVPESLELKQRIFRSLDDATSAGTLLATNTSSLSVTRIAEATGSPERVIGMHFFNPVHLMPLLELVRGDGTSDETVERALQLSLHLGKEPIVVRDAPGFASSRLGLALGLEAMRMLEQGVASAEDIDKAMVLGYRHPMGPLRLTDLIGLDVRLAIAEHLHRELGSDTFKPPTILERYVKQGRLGRKTGQGFFEW